MLKKITIGWTLLLLCSTLFAEPRLWTNQDGKTTVAEFVALSGETVVLKKKNKTHRIPLASLSPQDQEYVRAQVKETPEPPVQQFTEEQLRLPGKKGACFTLRPAGHRKGGSFEQNIPRITALDVSWNYSWGPTCVEQQPSGIEFVPMIWSARSKEKLKDAFRNVVIPDIESGKVKRLLGFNEPDKENQANMPYEKAIELWPEFEKLGIPLCSPACANPRVDNNDTQGGRRTWMPDFMEEAEDRGYRIDYIGVHWYGGCSPEGFKEKMKRVYKKYGQRPLLITEFSPADWKVSSPADNKNSPANVLAFMKEVLPWMEKRDWIAGYAWFSFRIDSAQGTSSALFDNDGKLTACGRYYKSVTPKNPRGDRSIKPDKPHH